MKIFINPLKFLGLLFGPFFLFTFFEAFSFHWSLTYWLYVSTITLPIAFLWTKQFKLPAIVASLAGLTLVLTPVDIVFESGEPAIQLLPTSGGIATQGGTFGYGCIQSHPPPFALVITL